MTLQRLIALVTFISVLAMAMRVSVDTDTWWHLRAGAWMVEHGQVLTRDVFSTAFNGQAWEYPAWLSETAMYLVFARWGYGGLDLFTAGLVTLAFVCVYLSCAGSAYVRAAAVILAATASAVFWSARPQIISFALAAATLLILELFRRRGRNLLWLLPPLMAVWANSHPGFAIGFLSLGLTGAGELVKTLLGRGDWKRVAWLAGTGAACLAALLLTPYGAGLLLYPFRTVSIGVLQNFILEWQSPNFHMREAQVFIGLWLATFAAIGFSRRALDLTDLFLLGGTLVLGLLAGRNIPLFALAAPPVLTRHVQAVLDDARPFHPQWVQWLEASSPATRLGTALNWLIAALVLLAGTLKVAAVYDPALNARLAVRGLPVGAVDFIARSGPPGPLFNPYEWGGYLAWRLYPDYTVYVDGRTDLYNDTYLRQYLRVAAGAPDWDALLAGQGVRLLLVGPASPLRALAAADADWTELYRDDTAYVFERRP